LAYIPVYAKKQNQDFFFILKDYSATKHLIFMISLKNFPYQSSGTFCRISQSFNLRPVLFLIKSYMFCLPRDFLAGKLELFTGSSIFDAANERIGKINYEKEKPSLPKNSWISTRTFFSGE